MARRRGAGSTAEQLFSEGDVRQSRGEVGVGTASGERGISGHHLGQSEKQLKALLKKRLEDLKELSLKMRSVSVLMDGRGMVGETEIRRISTSLQRLERELRRLQRSNESVEEKHDRFDELSKRKL